MHFVERTVSFRDTAGEARPKTPVHPGSSVLRRAVRESVVSFPAQIPVLLKQPQADMQWRVVLLYFVRGWSSARIAARFHVPKHRIRKSLNQWSVRALALGYVQVIDHEAFAACCGDGAVSTMNPGAEGIRLAAVPPGLDSVSEPLPDAEPAVGDRVSEAVDRARPADSLFAALDDAIGHCEEWRDEFWFRLAMLLRDVKTAAVAALERERPSERADGFFVAFHSGESSLRQGLRVHDEGEVSHAA
jgi:hypothetical protein